MLLMQRPKVKEKEKKCYASTYTHGVAILISEKV